MKEVKINVPRSDPGFAWMNRLLWIDLSSMVVSTRESNSYLPEYLGGRGLAAKIAWESRRSL
jgi:aldehyde:ferredoxin oxidoreductase